MGQFIPKLPKETPDGSCRILLEGNPYPGFPSNDRFALCLLSKEHPAMNSWEGAPWRGGRAGGYSRRSLEGDPVKGSSSKSVRGSPEPRHPSGIVAFFRYNGTTELLAN